MSQFNRIFEGLFQKKSIRGEGEAKGIYNRYFFLKFEHFAWISDATLWNLEVPITILSG